MHVHTQRYTHVCTHTQTHRHAHISPPHCSRNIIISIRATESATVRGRLCRPQSLPSDARTRGRGRSLGHLRFRSHPMRVPGGQGSWGPNGSAGHTLLAPRRSAPWDNWSWQEQSLMKKQLDCVHYIHSSIARLPDEPSAGAGAHRSGLGSVS